MDDTVSLILFRQTHDIVKPLFVRRKTCTVDLQIAVGDIFQLFINRLAAFGHQIAEKAGAGTGLFADHDSSGRLHQVVQLPVGIAMGLPDIRMREH